MSTNGLSDPNGISDMRKYLKKNLNFYSKFIERKISYLFVCDDEITPLTNSYLSKKHDIIIDKEKFVSLTNMIERKIYRDILDKKFDVFISNKDLEDLHHDIVILIKFILKEKYDKKIKLYKFKFY